MDIPYVQMARGFVYLAAVIDWHSRRVPAWRLSISMDTAFCTEAVEEAITKYGKSEIFNTDQGSQFTSSAFAGMLHGNGIRVAMDGKGICRDNVFIKRIWRSIKYEEVYLHAYETVCAAREGIGRYIKLLQHPPAALEPSCSNPRLGFLRIVASAFGRSSPTPQSPLKNPRNLFRSMGPALLLRRILIRRYFRQCPD